MAKIMHDKSLSDLDTNKEYLVYYTGTYDEQSQPVGHTCDGFGKIKHYYYGWSTNLYARGSNTNTTLLVTVTSIDTSFIIEL